MIRILSQIISWSFLPLFMPIYTLLVVFYLKTVDDNLMNFQSLYVLNPVFKKIILGVFILFSVIAPGISLLIMKKNNIIGNLEVDNHSERSFPIITTLAYCLILSIFLLLKFPVIYIPSVIHTLAIGGFIAMTITLIINRFTKISLHTLTAGMSTGFLLAYYQSLFVADVKIVIISFIIAGLIGSARLYLNKHTLFQVFLGFFTGFISLFLTTKYLPKYIYIYFSKIDFL